jgi:hypothetical protein
VQTGDLAFLLFATDRVPIAYNNQRPFYPCSKHVCYFVSLYYYLIQASKIRLSLLQSQSKFTRITQLASQCVCFAIDREGRIQPKYMGFRARITVESKKIKSVQTGAEMSLACGFWAM